MSSNERKEQREESDKATHGRPVKNVIEPTDAAPEELARAICLAADKKLAQKRKIRNG